MYVCIVVQICFIVSIENLIEKCRLYLWAHIPIQEMWNVVLELMDSDLKSTDNQIILVKGEIPPICLS